MCDEFELEGFLTSSDEINLLALSNVSNQDFCLLKESMHQRYTYCVLVLN